MQASVEGQTYLDYMPGKGLLINQVRIGVELGSTPWSTVPFRAPASETRLATFGVPVGPPTRPRSQPKKTTRPASTHGGRITSLR